MTLAQLLLRLAKTLRRLKILTDLDQDLWDQLQARATHDGVPLRELIRRALQEFLKSPPPA